MTLTRGCSENPIQDGLGSLQPEAEGLESLQGPCLVCSASVLRPPSVSCRLGEEDASTGDSRHSGSWGPFPCSCFRAPHAWDI